MEAKEKKNSTATKVMLLMGIGFVIDVGQAVIFYNTGKSAEAKAQGGSYKWKLPTGRELLKTASIVLVTSLLTGLLVSAAESAMLPGEKPEKKPKQDPV